MKRKIVMHGRSSLSVTLPKRWIDKFNLTSGDDVEVTEYGNEVVVSTDKEMETESRTIDIRKLNKMTPKAISALYKSGYDEIEVSYDRAEQLEVIKKLVEEMFIGFEIVEERGRYVKLKNVTTLNYGEFDRMLKRAFQVLITMGTDSFEAFKSYDKQAFENVIRMDSTINKLMAFNARALNKRDLANIRKTKTIYAILDELERIGDCYKNISLIMLKNKRPISDELIKLFGEINAYFKDFYKLYYRFDLKDAEKFFSKRDDFLKKIHSIKISDRVEHMIRQTLYRLFNHIYGMNGPLMVVNL